MSRAARRLELELGAPQVPARAPDPVRRLRPEADPERPPPGPLDFAGQPVPELVDRVDDGEGNGDAVFDEQAPLDLAVAAHRPVPREMVVAEIGEDRDLGHQDGTAFELEARDLADDQIGIGVGVAGHRR